MDAIMDEQTDQPLRTWSRDIEHGRRFVFPESNRAVTAIVLPNGKIRILLEELPPQPPPRLTKRRRLE
jgi:hypothetical protein